MNASIKTFFAAHKTTVMIASAALVIGAKSFSFIAEQNRQQTQMPVMPQQQMQQQPNGQMPQGYNQQMPQQNMNNQEEGFFDSWFSSNNEESYNAYNNTGSGYSGYTGGYAGNSYYNTNTGSANYYNPSANQVDYTSGWYKTQASQDAQHERFTDYIRDETKYNDAEGNSYKLSSGYDYNYVNTTNNTYVQTNDAGYDPNTYSTSTYTAVTPSDYSSSSSSSGGE